MELSLCIRTATRSALFPYTTLFRSLDGLQGGAQLGDLCRKICGHVLEVTRSTVSPAHQDHPWDALRRDRKSTRLNSSHVAISYAVFCLKKKNKKQLNYQRYLEQQRD